MHPQILLNWPAIIVSVIAAFVVGGIWYGPLFGKTWGKLMGMPIDKKPDPKVMRKAFTLQLLGLFLTAYVLAHSNQVWRASVWGVGTDQPNFSYGFFGAFFTWIGFYLPMQFSKVAWENRPWKLFFINAAHDFVILQVMSMILAYWR